MSDWVMIGVPTSAGAHHAGQERAPDALRDAGLADRLRDAGESVRDAGNLPGAMFAVDHDHPGGRNLNAVAAVARQVADAVADLPESGELPLIVGGDCTITLGAVAGLSRRHADVGLIYVDGDADLGVPGSDGSGIFDSMGISHLLGRGAAELTWLGGTVPLLDPARLAIVGADPRETDEAGRKYLSDAGVSFQRSSAAKRSAASTGAGVTITTASKPVAANSASSGGSSPNRCSTTTASGHSISTCLRTSSRWSACADITNRRRLTAWPRRLLPKGFEPS